MLTLRPIRATKLKCPKHPRFNPAAPEQIPQGHCRVCHQLSDVYDIYDILVRAIARAEQLASLERGAKP